MTITLEFINGPKVGIEHLSFDEDEEDDVSGVVILDLLFLRVCLVSYR